MPLDFPSNPINGQTYDNYYWDASSNAWRSSGTKAGLQPRVTALELADATTNKSGLVPIVPPNVVVSGGSAVTSLSGEVTFTGTSGIALNNIFSSNYRSYRIILSGLKAAAGNPAISMRFTDSAGTPNSTSQYYLGGYTVYGSGGSVYNLDAATQAEIHTGLGGNAWCAITIEIRNPNVADYTNFQTQYSGYGAGARNGFTGGMFDASSMFYGLQIYANTGTQITGQVSVYGYSK